MTGGVELALREAMGGASDPAGRLAKSLADAAADGSLGRQLEELPAVARRVVADKVSEEIAALAGNDVRDMLVGGWRLYGKLHRAAEETAADPAAVREVELAGHRITWKDRPTIEVFLDGARLTTLHVEFVVTMAIDGLHATVQGGVLVSVDVGDVVAELSVSVERHTWESPPLRLDLPGSLPLGDGIRLASPPVHGDEPPADTRRS